MLSQSSNELAESPSLFSSAIDNSGRSAAIPASTCEHKQVSRDKLDSSDRKASMGGLGSSAGPKSSSKPMSAPSENPTITIVSGLNRSAISHSHSRKITT